MDERTKAETATPSGRSGGRLDEALALVRQALGGLRYGQIAITVQDGVVIQIERTERTRLARNAQGRP
ncbi:MAG: YezD family protein [Planctomycetia bacterium]|nr:YezD family protein [Planctomycetia bacterium]